MRIISSRISLFDALLVMAFMSFVGWHMRRQDTSVTASPSVRPAIQPEIQPTVMDDNTGSDIFSTNVSPITEAALNEAGYTGRRVIPFKVREKNQKK